MAGLHVSGCQQDSAAEGPSLASVVEAWTGGRHQGGASWGMVLLQLSNTQSTPVGSSWAADGVP